MTKTDFKVYSGIKVEFNVGDLDKTNIIYKLTFPNGKVYIGQTSQTLRRRLTRHCCENEDTFKCRAINKYKSFNCEILYQGEDLDNQEIEFIKQYNSTNREYGYNLESGGHNNKHLSEETKEKIRVAHKGTKHSEETKRNISESLKNNKKNNSKAIIVTEIKTGKEIEFISITEAARYYDCNNANITDVLNNRLKTFNKKQYTAKYK